MMQLQLTVLYLTVCILYDYCNQQDYTLDYFHIPETTPGNG
jgi:hypothetical protein